MASVPDTQAAAGGKPAARTQRIGKGEFMAIAKRDEGSKVNSDINVTPMVDVMLVLLIIFMVVTPMLQKGVSVDLAKVNNPEQMTGKIKDRIANRVDKRVYIRADARAKFGRVVEVVDNIRAAGVDQLGLLTDQRKERPAGSAPPTPAPTGGQ